LIVFNLELTLFALLCIFITSKAIDYVQLRTSAAKLILMIISKDNEEKIQTYIQQQIDRGLTKVRSIGSYTEKHKRMIICLAVTFEDIHLKYLIQKEEPSTFVVFLNASDILGRGFTIDKYDGQKL